MLVCVLSSCAAFDPPNKTPEPGSMFSACCGALGACVAGALIPTEFALRLPADSCGPDLLCAPRAYLTERGATSCRAPGDLEGRCLPECLPEVMANADVLRRSSCAEGELCSPCFDPIGGVDLAVCWIGGDRPREAVKYFERCCWSGAEAGGACVPTELLTEAQLGALPVDTCTTPNTRCAPIDLLVDGGRLPSCADRPDEPPLVCARACFLTARLANFLPQRTCRADERCVPCADFAATGACR